VFVLRDIFLGNVAVLEIMKQEITRKFFSTFTLFDVTAGDARRRVVNTVFLDYKAAEGAYP
jgi:hypothetical protein